MTYLFLAYAVIWLALFAYMFHLSSRQKKLTEEVETLRKRLAEKNSA